MNGSIIIASFVSQEPNPRHKEGDPVPILKIILFGLLVVVVSILFWMLIGLIVSPTGSETPLNYLALLPCLLVPFLFGRTNKTASFKTALTQGIVWAIMLGLVIFPLSIGSQGLKWVFKHPEIYLMPVAIFMGPVIYCWLRSLRK